MDLIEVEKKYSQSIADLKTQRNAGEITQAQYQELVYDLLDTNTIEQELTIPRANVVADKLTRVMYKLAEVVPKPK